MRFGRLLLLPILCLAAIGSLCSAQDEGSQALRVLHATLHTEGDKAELCLEFDHALDVSSRTHAAFKLETDDKPVAVTPQSFSITASFFCLPQLDYGKDYHLALSRLRGAKGEVLGESYDISFTIPARKPALVFAGEMSDGLMRWNDNAPVLHSVNVAAAHVELYRLTALDDIANAWTERQQTALAPSESIYFARHKGQLVWQGDVMFEGVSNKTLEQKITFPSESITPGFYLVIASAPDVKIDPSEAGLAPLAAALFVRSGINIHAARGSDGVYALAESKGAMFAGIHATLLDQERHVLAEGQTDADGIAFLPLAEDKQGSTALLIGQSSSGDIGFADLGGKYDRPVLPGLEPKLSTDRPFYAPSKEIDATLTLRDVHGHAVNIAAGGTLQILRADRSPYAHVSVPAADNGIVRLSLPAPATNGIWPLAWQGADGGMLTETSLRVTSNRDAPRLTVVADRGMLSGDNNVSLQVASVTDAGVPAPYLDGRIFVAWTTPKHVFPGWDDYSFGGGENISTPAQAVATFITDGTGKADVHLTLKAPSGAPSLRAAMINIKADPASGAPDPAPLLLPSSPGGIVVGVKPLAENARFAENSLAKFAVVALDTGGKRADADNLSFQVYDEGRSFEWFQSEGRWDYKPLQQSRRIGGKTFSLRAQGDNVIEWPVTSGSYRLDITGPDGEVLSRINFGAGWDMPKTDVAPPAHLAVTSSAKELLAGETAHVHFTLDAPSMIAAFIADDHIHKVIHQPGTKGDNSIAFTPEQGWGDHILVHIEAYDANAAGEIVMPLAASTSEPAKAKETSAAPPTLAFSDGTPLALSVGDVLEENIELTNGEAQTGVYKYSLSATGVKLSGGPGAVTLAPGFRKTVPFTLHASEPGEWAVKLDVAGPHGFHESQTWPVEVRAPQMIPDRTAEYKLDPEKSWPATPSKPQVRNGSGFLFIAPEPLLDAPYILSLALEGRPSTTSALAERLEMLRLWRDAAARAGLMPEHVLSALQDESLLRLLQRQKPDGSFPDLPGADGDLVGTAAAVMALAHTGRPEAQPVIESANNWLRHKLENTWFDERERPERAAVYAMLAAADMADQGGLRYFSDTSADKELPPLAAVQLAAAFAHINDHDKALFWLGRAQIKKGASDIDPRFLPYLAENAFFDPHDLLPALQQLPQKITADTDGRAWASSFLRALAALENRDGGWRVTINGSIKNPNGVYVLPIGEKLPVLANPNDGPIFIAEASLAARARDGKTATIVRHIYRLDGTGLENIPLQSGETYLMILDGDWPARTQNGNDYILVQDDPGPAFSSASCAIDGTSQTGDQLKWIRDLGLTPLAGCEKPERSIFTLLARPDNEQKSWRIAYLAKAGEGGVLSRTPARAYRDNGVFAEEIVKGPVKISR